MPHLSGNGLVISYLSVQCAYDRLLMFARLTSLSRNASFVVKQLAVKAVEILTNLGFLV